MSSDGDLHWLEIPKSHQENTEDEWGQLPEGGYPLSGTERPEFIPDVYWQKGRRAMLTVPGGPLPATALTA